LRQNRNNSELAIQRYKRIIGRSLHSRDFENQKIESIIGASYSGEFFRTVFGQKIDVKLSKPFPILALPKYTSAGVLYPKL